MAENGYILELTGVTKEYASCDGIATVPVLMEVNLAIKPGQTLAIVGPSGSGKSTLLNIMGALDQPSSGRVRMGGRELSGLEPRELARIRNQEVGFVFQLHHLLSQLTVMENVLVPTLAGYAPPRGDAVQERAAMLLERVGLGHRSGHLPSQLSVGERQRAALVRALINRPCLLLADEPTGALDRMASAEMTRLLKELNKQEGVALVLATHSQELAKSMGSVYQLDDGILKPWEISG